MNLKRGTGFHSFIFNTNHSAWHKVGMSSIYSCALKLGFESLNTEKSKTLY